MSKSDFVRLVTAEQPEAPQYFALDASLNRKERELLDDTLARGLKALPVEALLRISDAGAQVLDTRDSKDFAAAHLPGSLNIGLGGQYASWAGTLLDPANPIVLVAEPGREHESAMRLGRIGLDRVEGYLEGGIAALESRPDLVTRTERITALTLAEQLAAPNPPLVLDVRTPGEWQEKHVEGSLNVPLSQLPRRLTEVPRDRRIVVHCASGYRSSMAASLLERHGIAGVADLVGGIGAWEASRLQTVSAQA